MNVNALGPNVAGRGGNAMTMETVAGMGEVEHRIALRRTVEVERFLGTPGR
jgi:hypothetical protein